jgi:hypothetical protein
LESREHWEELLLEEKHERYLVQGVGLVRKGDRTGAWERDDGDRVGWVGREEGGL